MLCGTKSARVAKAGLAAKQRKKTVKIEASGIYVRPFKQLVLPAAVKKRENVPRNPGIIIPKWLA
jgi:hypothetical protein